MKTDELQKYIQNLSPELYSFAYVLIPDDLQASQLMIDCVQSFLVQKKSLVEKMGQAKNKILKNHLEDTKLHIMRIIYELARKRYHQLKISLSDVENNANFFSLELHEKAMLYLKEKSQFSLEQIELITLSTRSEVLAHLYSARIKMAAKMPDDLFKNEIEIGGIV